MASLAVTTSIEPSNSSFLPQTTQNHPKRPNLWFFCFDFGTNPCIPLGVGCKSYVTVCVYHLPEVPRQLTKPSQRTPPSPSPRRRAPSESLLDGLGPVGSWQPGELHFQQEGVQGQTGEGQWGRVGRLMVEIWETLLLWRVKSMLSYQFSPKPVSRGSFFWGDLFDGEGLGVGLRFGAKNGRESRVARWEFLANMIFIDFCSRICHTFLGYLTHTQLILERAGLSAQKDNRISGRMLPPRNRPTYQLVIPSISPSNSDIFVDSIYYSIHTHTHTGKFICVSAYRLHTPYVLAFMCIVYVWHTHTHTYIYIYIHTHHISSVAHMTDRITYWPQTAAWEHNLRGNWQFLSWFQSKS